MLRNLGLSYAVLGQSVFVLSLELSGQTNLKKKETKKGGPAFDAGACKNTQANRIALEDITYIVSMFKNYTVVHDT